MITYSDTQDRSPSNPSFTEWDVAWPVAIWYIGWHAAICLAVVSLPSRLFSLKCGPQLSYIQILTELSTQVHMNWIIQITESQPGIRIGRDL